jgi:hypothetical protein
MKLSRLFLISAILPAVLAARGAADEGRLPALAPLPGTGTLAPPADPARFSFFVAGDSRPKGEKDIPTYALQETFIEAGAAKPPPAFLVLLGNVVYGKNARDHDLLAGQYKHLVADGLDAKVPLFNAPGNDEMDDDAGEPSAVMLKWYEEMIGHPFGAFDYGNSHFIVLNTNEVPPPAARGAAPGGGYVSPGQLDLLKRDLDAHRGTAHVFVFMHHPLKPRHAGAGLEPAAAKALLDLFKGYPNIAYVLAAHEHIYYNPQEPANLKTPPGRIAARGEPIYLVSGGGGSPLTVPRTEGGFFHYLIFHVAGDQVSVALAEPDDSCPD